jgi:hypothetical protein
MLGDREIIRKILSHLQALIVDTKVDINNYMSLKEIYDYELQLYSAISLSPVAYAEAFNAIGMKQEDLFHRVLADIYQNPNDIDEVINESNNLYYLNDDGLIYNPLYEAQVKKSEEVILNFQHNIKKDLEGKSHLLLFKEELDDKLVLVKQLLDFASYFNPVGLEREVKDINNFTNVLETLNLEEEEKTRILLLALKKNVEVYKDSIKNNRFVFAEDEVEKEKVDLIEISNEVEKEELMTMIDEAKDEDVEVLDEATSKRRAA